MKGARVPLKQIFANYCPITFVHLVALELATVPYIHTLYWGSLPSLYILIPRLSSSFIEPWEKPEGRVTPP